MYFSALPGYQGVPLSQLRFSRVLFGGFPSFAASPLKPAFDRVLQASRAPMPGGITIDLVARQMPTHDASRAGCGESTCSCLLRGFACCRKHATTMIRTLAVAHCACFMNLQVHRAMAAATKAPVHRWATPAPARARSASAALAAWSGTCRASRWCAWQTLPHPLVACSLYGVHANKIYLHPPAMQKRFQTRTHISSIKDFETVAPKLCLILIELRARDKNPHQSTEEKHKFTFRCHA